MKLIIGFVLGLVVASVGFSGIARMLDRGVQTIQTQSQELAKWFWQTRIHFVVDNLNKINYNMYMLSSKAQHFL